MEESAAKQRSKRATIAANFRQVMPPEPDPHPHPDANAVKHTKRVVAATSYKKKEKEVTPPKLQEEITTPPELEEHKEEEEEEEQVAPIPQQQPKADEGDDQQKPQQKEEQEPFSDDEKEKSKAKEAAPNEEAAAADDDKKVRTHYELSKNEEGNDDKDVKKRFGGNLVTGIKRPKIKIVMNIVVAILLVVVLWTDAKNAFRSSSPSSSHQGGSKFQEF